MFCNKCGLPINDDETICPSCGTKVNKDELTTELSEINASAPKEKKKLGKKGICLIETAPSGRNQHWCQYSGSAAGTKYS